MFGNIGFGELVLIGLIALLLFGPNKLPELGRSLGKMIREFKQGTHDLLNDEPQAPQARKDVTPPEPAQSPPQAAPETPQSPPSAAAEQPAPQKTDNQQNSRRLPD